MSEPILGRAYPKSGCTLEAGPQELAEAREEGLGWCVNCGDFQYVPHDDAEKVKCSCCRHHQVYGLDKLDEIGFLIKMDKEVPEYVGKHEFGDEP